MDTSTYAPTPGIEGAAARLDALETAAHAANAARLAYMDETAAPLLAAREAAFATVSRGSSSSSPEWDAACAAVSQHYATQDADPVLRDLNAAHAAARAAVADAAMSYMVATTLVVSLLRIHRGGGWHAGPDVSAILWALPEGPIKGLDGWRKVTVSPHGAWNSRREVRLCHHRVVVVTADNEGRSRITGNDEEHERIVRAHERNMANHTAYQVQLAKARGAIDADDALRAAVAVLYAHHGETTRLYGPAVESAGHGQGHPAMPVEEPARSAALALAYVGWGWVPGQEGGVLLIPGGGPVGVRGALRIPREVSRG